MVRSRYCMHHTVILALYSIVTLTARQLVSQGTDDRHAAWYAKDSSTFFNTIALVRCSLWSGAIYGGSRHQGDMLKIPRV